MKKHHDQVLPPDPPPGTSERIEWTPEDEAAADRAWAKVRQRILARMDHRHTTPTHPRPSKRAPR